MPLLRLTLILLIALSLSAQQKEMRPEVRFWTQTMQQETLHLKAGRYADALRLANRTIADMVERLGPGQSATEMFGIVLTHKALAHAGLGQTDDARWYWHSALTLYPKFAKSDLSMFGEPGKFLKANMKGRTADNLKNKNVMAPKVRTQPKPHYPSGAHHFGVDGKLEVEVIINAQGKAESPRVVRALPAPTLSFVALETLRQSTWAPATVDGKPVTVIMNLTVDFKPR